MTGGDSASPRRESLLDEMKLHAAYIFTEDVAAAESGRESVASLTFAGLLGELGLGHLESRLGDFADAEQASAELTASRTDFLAKLKALGVEKLGERQALANGLAKASRAGRLGGK